MYEQKNIVTELSIDKGSYLFMGLKIGYSLSSTMNLFLYFVL